ncbi:hypothetical protein HK405_000549 [Cladochytrium tenue]|nr:hypothetical protein HK405_000549 [Cladochytrium tenue]
MASSGKGVFTKLLQVINIRSGRSKSRNRRQSRKERKDGSPSSALSVERPIPPLSAPEDDTGDIKLRARNLIKLILEDDPEFRRAAPPFVLNLCEVESDSGAGTVSNTNGENRWLQKAVDFVASDNQQTAVMNIKASVHDVASAGAQNDVLSEKLKSMLVCVDKVVEIVDDFVEVHSLVKITWTLAIYGYKVGIFLTLSANTTK